MCDLSFEHPIGLAAGFDKNAEAVYGLSHQGFGFIEVGTVTPKPQLGNAKPRLFRLSEDQAIINRMGFNNKGKDAFIAQLKAQSGISMKLGANIGKNKDTEDPYSDYIDMLEAVYGYTDYITVNISSPNTPGLRDLQSADAFAILLEKLIACRNQLAKQRQKKIPLWIKIAPDISTEQQQHIARLALEHAVDALIVSNTTIARDGLRSSYASESGGLSGKPLLASSTAILRNMYCYTQGRIPLIGVGGISSAEDVYHKIRNGASLVQLYSALIYQGFGLLPILCEGLSTLLARDGFSSVNEAVGVDAS